MKEIKPQDYIIRQPQLRIDPFHKEGKTKHIWETKDPSLVIIESKDDITAGDGERRDIIPGKGKLANETTSNVFRLLNKHGIPNHFAHSMSDTSFLAKRADMIPLECVARRIAYGSYLKRNPGTSEGEKFEKPIVEFFFKDDTKHDPYVALDPENAQGVLYNPKHPIQRGAHMGVIPFSDLGADIHRLRIMKHLTRKVFETLEDAWAIQNVALVDLKIEFGQDINGNLMVADVIDNDSWRIWPNGDKTKMLDKQLYRDGSNLKLIIQNYQKVAEMTKNF